MIRTPSSRLSLLATLSMALILLAACTSDAASGPTAASDATDANATSDANAMATASSATSVPAEQVANAEGVECLQVEGPATDIAGWPLAGSESRAFQPIVVSQMVTVGPSRFLYAVLDDELQPMASEDMASSVAFYAIDRDPGTPVATVDGTFLDAGAGRGLYRTSMEFDCPGEWGAEVSVALPDGSVASERMRFQVHTLGTTPAVGEPAPRSDSLTAATPDETRLVSTDPDPYAPAYERTIAEVVTAGQPSLILFATPAFCQTGVCGPTVDLVESVAREYEGRVGYVNVEPYQLQMTENGLQPLLDEQGQLQPVQAVLDYGLLVEPYLFVVDAEGDIAATFEAVVGADELRAAIEDVLAA